jgi:deoxyribodipyrimidine photolyase-related protein
MPSTKAFVILPNQLYSDISLLKHYDIVYIVEEPAYFYDPIYKPFKVNKVKVAYLRACMKHHNSILTESKLKTEYLDYTFMLKNHPMLFKGYESLTMYDPIDLDVLNKYENMLKASNTKLNVLESPDMLLPKKVLLEDFYSKPKNIVRHASFLKFVKEKLHILEGVQNLDKMNRSPPPKDEPNVYKYKPSRTTLGYYEEAIAYTNKHFDSHYGDASNVVHYPISHVESMKAFKSFLQKRLPLFGKYEDAVMRDDAFMYHSVISPMLNNGLLNPLNVVKQTLTFYSKHDDVIPLSSLEGFIRQIVGWRCMMQSLYIFRHDDLIKSNLPGNTNKFKNPKIWYNGETGIYPLDEEIKKARNTGYAHHIVRLMIFMNFFILCELHPYEIYKWFMEVVSIDAYSWVMISNIYAMGYFYPKVMSKPYISSSNYIVKMTDYKKDGHWDMIWDALYHDFLRNKPSSYTFFYKRTFKDIASQETMAKEFKSKHFSN